MEAMHDSICDMLEPHFAEGVVDKNHWVTQLCVYYLFYLVGGHVMYLVPATLSYYHSFVWRKDKYFPKGKIDEAKLGEQIRAEISASLKGLWGVALLMLPGGFFVHRGYSKVYKEWPTDAAGYGYMVFSIVAALVFTDCVIYFMHRGLHHPVWYRPIHKLHHVWRYTTPFSSHALSSLDAFTQGFPYYVFVFLVPMHASLFSAMFAVVNMWTISIHDEITYGTTDTADGKPHGSRIFMSTGHHTCHHTDFLYDYGQYTSLWDRLCGTYCPAIPTHDWVTGERLPQPKED